jgi:hypothetical protein
MRTLYNDSSKGDEARVQRRDVGALTYVGLTQANNNNGDLSPHGLLFALGDMGADVAELVPTLLKELGNLLRESIDPPDWAHELIEGLDQFCFETDLNGLRWDDLFNPDPYLGLRTASIARVFWVVLAVLKGAPALGRSGISLVNKVNSLRRNIKTKHFRAEVNDALDELRDRVPPVGHDSRVRGVPDMDDLLTQLATSLFHNNTGTKRELGRLLKHQGSDV